MNARMVRKVVPASDLQVGDVVMDMSRKVKSVRRWADEQVWMTEVTWDTSDVKTIYDSRTDRLVIIREVQLPDPDEAARGAARHALIDAAAALVRVGEHRLAVRVDAIVQDLG